MNRQRTRQPDATQSRDLRARSLGSRSAAGGPRYRQLADTLIRELERGRWAIGSTLPGEIELGRRFDVSRHTIREALRQLEALGLIERRRRIGTVVRSITVTDAYAHSIHSLSDLLQYPPGSRLQVESRGDTSLPAAIAHRLHAKPGETWYRISGSRRLAGRGPRICWVDVYVRPELADVASMIGRTDLRIFELIEQRFGRRVARVTLDLQAGRMAPEIAGYLAVPRGSPSLSIVRRYYDDAGELFEAAIAEHPADRFSYTLELRRERMGVYDTEGVGGRGAGVRR